MNRLPEDLVVRVISVERQLRNARLLAWVAIVVAIISVVGAWLPLHRVPDTLRAKAIVIEDAQGQDRIVLGAPILEPAGARRELNTGMVIRDPDGVERFGVGLMADGVMNMGFDAPLGKGDDRNRERVDISTDPEGGAEIRVLDRATWVRARLALDRDNRVALEFLDFPTGETLTRRFSINGMELEREPRK